MNIITSKFSLLLLCLLQFVLVSVSYAIDPPDLRIINAGLGKQIAIKVAGLPTDDALFEVRTQSGRILLQRAIHSTEYKALFNLEHLAEGPYMIVLSTSQQEIVQPIRIMKRAVLYNVTQREHILKPEIRLKGRQLDIDYENPQKHAVTVSLQTTGGKVLHQQTVEEAEEVELRMNLLRLSTGSYRLVVESGEKAWSETIRL